MFSSWPFVLPCVFRASVHNGRHQSREQDILKMNEATLMQTGRSGLRGRSMKMSTFGVRRSKVKVTRRENRLKNAFRRNVSITIWRILTKPGSTVTANADCVITTRMQKNQRPTPRDAQVRFGALAEASFSTPLGPVAFLVYFCWTIKVKVKVKWIYI